MPQEELNKEELLRAENDYLKMKLMLEKGAEFMDCNSGEKLPPEIENEFLKHIEEFEKQWDSKGRIKIFDKIGKPDQFRPAAEIPDDKINQAWEDLSHYMDLFGIHLDVCSPRITARELYRFTLEELFEYEMDNINLPGMMHGFIYDEFHPDVFYDNTVAAEDGMNCILCSEPVRWLTHFREERLQLNQYDALNEEELKERINRFKADHEHISLSRLSDVECTVNDKLSIVKGKYVGTITKNASTDIISGNWTIYLESDPDSGFWYIYRAEIEGIEF